jgi:hypothetical protein
MRNNLGEIKTLNELRLVRERLKYQALIQEQKLTAEVNTVRYNIGLALKEVVVQFGQKFLISTAVKMLRGKK